MKPNPRLVEALDSFVGDVAAMPVRRELIEAFIREHRLVRLPEEPDGYQAELMPGEWSNIYGLRSAEVTSRRYMGRIRPVYIYPGDPQEVEP